MERRLKVILDIYLHRIKTSKAKDGYWKGYDMGQKALAEHILKIIEEEK